MAKKTSSLKTKIIVFVIITCFICLTLIFSKPLENYINNFIFPQVKTDVDTCDMKVHFIDVGQGDSILIELPDDKIMLIDAGANSGEDKLIAYLNSIFSERNDKDIDYFVITHQDSDHTGGADVVFDNFNIINFYRPNVFTDNEKEEYSYVDVGTCNSDSYTTMISKMYAENCNWFLNTVYESMPKLDENIDYSIEFLSPIDDTYTKPNDYSPIILLSYQNRKFMFTGDATTNVEEQVLNTYSSDEFKLKCDVLKVGHHGSNTSTSLDFLNAISPTYAVICVGEDNTYGHPTDTIMARLKSVVGENNILRTDLNGNIIFGIDKDSKINNLAEIKIATNKAPVISVYVEWWTIVVIMEGICFMFIFIPKYSKKILKNK